MLMACVIYMPGPLGISLRQAYYGKKFKSCGVNLRILPGVIITNPEFMLVGNNVLIDEYTIINCGLIPTGYKLNSEKGGSIDGFLSIGNDVHIGAFCRLSCYGGIKIGSKCVIGSGCYLYSMSNEISSESPDVKDYSLMPYEFSEFRAGEIKIGDNTWIALNVIIMPSVKIGEDCFIASRNTILNDISENTYVEFQGNMKRRFRNE